MRALWVHWVSGDIPNGTGTKSQVSCTVAFGVSRFEFFRQGGDHIFTINRSLVSLLLLVHDFLTYQSVGEDLGGVNETGGMLAKVGFNELFSRLFPQGDEGGVVKFTLPLGVRLGADEVGNASGFWGDGFTIEIEQEPNGVTGGLGPKRLTGGGIERFRIGPGDAEAKEDRLGVR